MLVAAVELGPALPPFLGHVPSAVLSSLLSCLPLQRHVLWSVDAMFYGQLVPCSVVSWCRVDVLWSVGAMFCGQLVSCSVVG